MSIAEVFSDNSPYYSAHASLKDGAVEVGNVTHEQLKKLLREYFWEFEADAIQISEPRIKKVLSVSKKIEKKEAEVGVHPEQSKEEKILDYIEDFVGIRIIVSSKRYFPRIVNMIREDRKCWDVIEGLAYTQDAKEIQSYGEMGLLVDAKKTSGYCGIHFVLSLHGRTTDQVRKIEIQIRTKFQDAWQSFEHPMYKIQDSLPKKMQDIRNGLAKQSEATADSYEQILEFSHELASEKGLELPDQMKNWEVEYKKPSDYMWEVISPSGSSMITLLVVTSTQWIIVSDREKSMVELFGNDWSEKGRIKDLPIDLVLVHFSPESAATFEDHPNKENLTRFVREKHGIVDSVSTANSSMPLVLPTSS